MDEGMTQPDSNTPASDGPTQKFTPSVMQGLLGAAGSGVTRELRRWQPPSVEDLQKALPQYEISAFIACGGMGAVYKGLQKALKRPVAIKVLPPDIEDGDLHYAARFKHEAQAMARLSHPNIVAVFDAGETAEGLLYFVMEFIEGTDVAQLIASEGPLDPKRTVQITTAVCEALAFAHEEGIIHRDIKPSNIMLDKKGRVKVADFGLAKAINVESSLLTGSNVAMGTPDFIAPEALISGTLVDQRADLYAVGVMLYQMLTGKMPRGRFQSPSTIVPKVHKGFDAVVDKAMQTDRDRRYSTATALRTDVEKVAKKAGYNTPSMVQPQTAAQSVSRKPLLIAAVGIFILAAGGWLASIIFFSKNATESKPAGISSSPSLPVSASSPSEPAAIKLWDAPEKILSLQKANVRWENNAIHLDKAALPDGTIKQSDMIVRAEMLMNAGSASAQISGRVLRDGTGPKGSYSLSLKSGLKEVKLLAHIGDVTTELRAWPLSRSYQTGEWLPLELRIIGDEITASAEGRVLGSVKDSSIRGVGGVQLYAMQDGWFRKVEYVPLDEPVPAPVPKPTPAASSAPNGFPAGQWTKVFRKLEDLPADLRPPNGGVTWDSGVFRPNGMIHFPLTFRPWGNVGLRVKVPAKATGTSVTFGVRRTNAAVCYQCQLMTTDGGTVYIGRFDERLSRHRDLMPIKKVAALPRAGEEVAFEFFAIGDQLVARIDGQVVATLHDAELTSGLAYLTTDRPFHDIELLNLDGLSEAEALKVAGIGATAEPVKEK